jgi:hypothetical protein
MVDIRNQILSSHSDFFINSMKRYRLLKEFLDKEVLVIKQLRKFVYRDDKI